MSTLRNKLIKLGAEHPELREHIRPLLAAAEEVVEEEEEEEKKSSKKANMLADDTEKLAADMNRLMYSALGQWGIEAKVSKLLIGWSKSNGHPIPAGKNLEDLSVDLVYGTKITVDPKMVLNQLERYEDKLAYWQV